MNNFKGNKNTLLKCIFLTDFTYLDTLIKSGTENNLDVAKNILVRGLNSHTYQE